MSATLPVPETLPRLIRRALAQPREDVLLERTDGVWTETSSGELLERVENLACAIRDAGLHAGDRVALIAHNSVDWIVCDFATFFAGCVVVPIYPTQAIDTTAYILHHSGAKLLFVDSIGTVDELRRANDLPHVVVLGSKHADGLAAFEARGAAIRAKHPNLPLAYESQDPHELAVLIYTSGTTGQPKGVMLSHDNLGYDAQVSLEYGMQNIGDGDTVMSVLPYSHIYEHTMIYIYLLGKVRYAICHNPNELVNDMRDVRPVAMTCVPRIFDRVLAGVAGQAMHRGGAQAKLVPAALETGRQYMMAKTFGPPPSLALMAKYRLAKTLVLDKVRGSLGLDRIKYLTSGSAALHIDTAMTFLGLGIPVTQGYGLTETSPILTVNPLSINKFGTVGRPIPGTEIKIAEDGEILARGRQIMMGYYRDPDATAAAIVDGWFHTGDIGEIDNDGYLHVTDRKKEVFKTATGKFVAPARVEAAIKRSIFIAQAMVIGDGRPHPAALIVPNWSLLRVELGLPEGQTPDELSQREDVRSFISAEVRQQTADLGSFEQIRRTIVLPHEFTIESGELSPSMKIKRRVVEHRHADTIDRAYQVDLHEKAYV